jgi:tetratricopeptide (TPR) repeat protein
MIRLINIASRRKSVIIASLLTMAFAVDLCAQEADCHNVLTITGAVMNRRGEPVEGVSVQVEDPHTKRIAQSVTDSAGKFTLPANTAPQYSVIASKAGFSNAAQIISEPHGCTAKVALVLASRDSGEALSTFADDMDFADKPSFTIAGVTDWTAVGGHGSDSTLRTSESLVKSTVEMKSDSKASKDAESLASTQASTEDEKRLQAALYRAPQSYSANHRLGDYYLRVGAYSRAIPLLRKALDIGPADDDDVYELALAYENGESAAEASKNIHGLLSLAHTAKMFRLAALEDEKAGDSLRAVNEFQEAASRSPGEASYFEWGSELLLHRAVWQALDVFQSGLKFDPHSMRLQMAMAIALFSGARYNEAATQLCKIADENPGNQQAYIAMGEVQTAAPYPLDCIEPRLAKFASSQPANGEANYLYAMAVLKRTQTRDNNKDIELAQRIFERIIESDPKNSAAYLQLGILKADAGDYKEAIAYYNRAINANPELPEAYYRLGVAYDRLSLLDKAKAAFIEHDKLQKQQQDETEKKRLQIKQFLIEANR